MSRRRKENPSGVYLLHFERRYEHAGHYTGWAKNIEMRLDEHNRGQGARLTAVVKAAGIGWTVAKTWPGASRTFERQLKNRGGAAKYCPICQNDRKAAK